MNVNSVSYESQSLAPSIEGAFLCAMFGVFFIHLWTNQKNNR